MSDLGIHKLPSPEKLQRQMDQLQQGLAAAKKENQDLQNKQKTLSVIEGNYETMLRGAGIDISEREASQRAQKEVLS